MRSLGLGGEDAYSPVRALRPIGLFRVATALRPNHEPGAGPDPRPVKHGIARLKPWRVFRHSRGSPNRTTSIAKAVLTLDQHR